jgi:hypothetical protein
MKLRFLRMSLSPFHWLISENSVVAGTSLGGVGGFSLTNMKNSEPAGSKRELQGRSYSLRANEIKIQKGSF